MNPSTETDIAFFLATSGHSGVDRIMGNLIGEMSRQGLRIDLLRIAKHGPYLKQTPENVRLVELGTSHVNSSFLPLVRYLRKTRPKALLSDKDRLNRIALLARRVAGVETRIGVRLGTTVSENLAKRSWLDRTLQFSSIRCLYPWADAVIVPSAGAAKDLATLGRFPLERISVLPNPVVGNDFHALAEERLDHPWFKPGEPPVILGVGELSARKDFSTLIQAFAILRNQSSARLMILGEGKQRAVLEGLAESLGLQGQVEMPGFVSNPYPYMKNANLFVLSSICEGFGLVLDEALALGTPAVSTDCPSGPSEILGDGRFGRLVAMKDPQGLAQAMAEALAKPVDPDFLKQAVEPFTVANSTSRYLSALGLTPENQ